MTLRLSYPPGSGGGGSGDITIGTTVINGGTNTRILYDNAGVVGEYPIGTGVATALGINVGSAGAFITFNGAAGTPSSITLSNGTGLPISTGVSGLGANVATFLGTPSSANLRAALTDETGTGAAVFADTPTLVTPILGTPTSGTLTNCTGLPIGGLTGLGANVGTWLGTPSSANLAAAVTDETGSGALVFANTPTLVTPVLGVASATSINKVAITAPATSATLTIADGKTLTVSNSLTLAGTDATTMTFPDTSGTVMTLNKAQTITAVKTFDVATAGIVLGAASGNTGGIQWKGTTSGTVTIKVADAAGTYTLTLPTDDGNANEFLKTDGSGVLSWGAGGGGITIDSTVITGGTSTRLLRDNAGTVGETSGITTTGTELTITPAVNAVALTIPTVTTTAVTAALSITQTQNSTGTHTGLIFANLIPGASTPNAASKVLDLQYNTSSIFSVTRAGPVYLTSGSVSAPTLTVSGNLTTGIYFSGNNVRIASDGVNTFQFTASSGPALRMLSTGGVAWSNSSSDPGGSDTFITRGSSAAHIQLGNTDTSSTVAQTLRAQSIGAGNSNGNGATFTIQGSLGTGTGIPGSIVAKTGFPFKSGSATTQHTAVDRFIIVAQGKVLTDNTATSLFEVALPTLTMCGGVIEATVVCTDGTDMQSFTQTVTYSAVNKGGSYTKSITASTGDKSVSGGTITNTWSILDGTNKVTIQLTSDTSLTPSTNAFICYYTVKNNSEQATTIL